jgi:heparin binding hemagglutinin HbhA
MAITEDLRKTITNPTPLYFAAGTVAYAAERTPGLIERIRTEAPARIEAVRQTDPRTVQEKVSSQAKEAQATVQAKVNEVLGAIDGDLKKLGENAQDLALRSVGVAAEYAVKAREAYERVAEHGEQAVKQWRGEAAEEITELAVAVEPDSAPAPGAAEAKAAPGAKPAAKKTTAARKPPAKKTTPPAK